MKDWLAYIALIVLSLIAGFAPSVAPPEPVWITKATVVNVVDGDTVDVEIRRTIRVRLIDCWAPESRIDKRLPKEKRAEEKEAGKKSKAALTELALGKRVVLQVTTDEDVMKATTLGRVLGKVWLEGDDETLNEIQVRTGHATTEQRPELKSPPPE